MTREQMAELQVVAASLVGAAELAASLLLPGSGPVVALVDKGIRGILAYIDANSRDLTPEERTAANALSLAILARLEGTAPK